MGQSLKQQKLFKTAQRISFQMQKGCLGSRATLAHVASRAAGGKGTGPINNRLGSSMREAIWLEFGLVVRISGCLRVVFSRVWSMRPFGGVKVNPSPRVQGVRCVSSCGEGFR